MKGKREKLFLAGGLLLIIGAAIWRFFGTVEFYDLNDYRFTPRHLTFDYPDPLHPIVKAFYQLFPLFARDYLAPVLLLLLPGVILLSLYFAGRPREKDPLRFLDNPGGEKTFLQVIFLLGLLSTLAVHFLCLRDHAYVSDEFSYLFQGEVLRSGRLYLPSLPHHQHFHYFSLINDGKFYSKYTNGWPAFLSLGLMLGVPWLINPLLAGGSLVLAYLAGRQLYGVRQGFLSVILLGLSPFFIFNGASYWPHVTVGFFTLLSVFSLLKSEKSPKPWLLVAGICAGVVLNVRPADGGVIALGLIPLALFTWKKSGGKKAFGRWLLAGAGAFMIMAGLLLWCNYVQNGNPLQLGFARYAPDESWGFRPGGHTPLKGLWNLAYAFMRSCFWTVPLLLLLLMASVVGGRWKTRLLSIPLLLQAAFFFGYYSLGLIEFGSRFYFAGFAIVCLLAPGGVRVAARWRGDENGTLCRAGVLAMTIACLIYFAGSARGVFSRVDRQYATSSLLSKKLEKPLSPGVRTIIFIRNLPGTPVAAQTRNLPPFSKDPNLLSIFLTPGENADAAKAFPGRQPMILYFDYTRNDFGLAPMEPGKKSSPVDFIAAGINYSMSVDDKQKAMEVFKEALKTDPDNPGILFNLGYLYFELGSYPEALTIFRRLYSSDPRSGASIYYAARCVGEMGDRAGAGEMMGRFVREFPKSPRFDRAQQWYRYYWGTR